MMLLPLTLYWGLALWGLLSRRPVLLLLFFATLPLGTFAAIPPAMTGGFSLIASTVTLLLLAVKQLFVCVGGYDEIVDAALGTKPGRLLLAFWAVATVVTMFAPRFFMGRIVVIPMGEAVDGAALLAPTPQNFSQWTYLSVSVLAVLTLATFFRHAHNRLLLLDGLLLGGAVVIVTGFLDLASSSVPLDWVLSPFRTAGYAITTEQQLAGGVDRVIGLMSEPAAFASAAMTLLSFLYFARHLAEDDQRRRRCNRTLIGLVLMVILSTSSAGYAALGFLGVIAVFDWLLRSTGRVDLGAIRLGTVRELKALIMVLSVVVALAIVSPALFDPAIERVDTLLFDKSETSSFEERSMWTQVSLQAGFDSSMLGVGLGSTRASNYAAVLFASTGLAGFAFYLAFAINLLRQRPSVRDDTAQILGRTMKWSIMPVLVIDLTIGTTPNFGNSHALRWGVLLGIALASRELERRHRQTRYAPLVPQLIGVGRPQRLSSGAHRHEVSA